MIYWFTGQPGSGKTTLAKKLQMWLQTDKTNWRKSVFHIDGDQLRELLPNTDYTKEGRERNIRKAMDIAKYLHSTGHDVVVSLVSPYLHLREELKSECKVIAQSVLDKMDSNGVSRKSFFSSYVPNHLEKVAADKIAKRNDN
jgi:adenylylsulfate kinase-like enzyme